MLIAKEALEKTQHLSISFMLVQKCFFFLISASLGSLPPALRSIGKKIKRGTEAPLKEWNVGIGFKLRHMQKYQAKGASSTT